MTMNNPAWLGQLLRNGTIKQPDVAYAHVAPLYRAVELRADAISSVPYRLMRNGVEVEWPWKKNFSRLIAQTERSLLVAGAAYWVRIVKGRTLTGFEALNPTTVNYRYDPNMGTLENPYLGLSFNQVIGGKMYGPWTLEQIVYFRENSFIDDVGPGLAPAQVAMQNAQLSYNLDRFTSMFFEGGAQPVTVMNLPDSMDDSEFKRMGAEINQRGSGVLNAFKWIFVRAQELKVQKITPDINTLMMPELADRTLKQIAMTMGVPLTMLEASAANYATADSDRQSFWRETVIPRLPKLSDVLNEQLLGPLKYEIQFMPEQLDVMQADEAQRAGSLLQLTQAGVPLRAAMQILGYDNIADIVLPGDLASPESTPVEAPTDEGTVAPADMANTSKAVANEWALLSKKIERRIKSGRDPKTSFDSALIPADHIDAVMAHCYKGMTVADVHDVIHAVKAPVDDMTPDELRIYNRIIKEMRKKGEQWARDIVNERNPETSLRDVIKPVLDSELGTTMGKRIDRLGTQFDDSMNADNKERYIQDWLSDYTTIETDRIDKTTADRITPIIEMFRTTPGMTIQDIEAAVLPLSDPVRAKMIAITETTRAASQATTSYQDYLRERGVNMIRVWNTDADELVCPICAPLNGKTEADWGAEYPDGAPAHVNCRCDTSLRLAKEGEEVQPIEQQETEQPEAEAPQTQEAVTRQSSVDDLYDYAKSLLPEDAQQTAQELDAAQSNLVTLRKELKKLPDGSPEQAAKQAEIKAQQLEMIALWDKKTATDGQAARELLQSLQHETPQTVNVTFSIKGLSADDKARVEELIKLTAGIAPDSGQPMTITVKSLGKVSGAGAAWSGSGANGTVYLSPQTVPDIYVIHETLHGLQANYRYGVAATDAWVAPRIQGETDRRMSTLDSARYGHMPNNMVAYKDAVEDIQTLHYYPKSTSAGTKLPEVLTMPITSLTQATNGKDPDLLRLFLQIAKDGGK